MKVRDEAFRFYFYFIEETMNFFRKKYEVKSINFTNDPILPTINLPTSVACSAELGSFFNTITKPGFKQKNDVFRVLAFISKMIFCLFFVETCYAQVDSAHLWGKWKNWGDQKNGTYFNPILPADYSDLDCIRVGSDYYAVSSTFQYSPGFIILHSKDLVNWSIAGHVVNDVTQISPEMNWNKMNRYGKGIWAGAIRYHDNKFWVYFGTADEGYFMSTAKKIEGPWTPLHHILKAKGWDDCSPFWDDDGQGYLIGTNFSDNYAIHLFKMTPDGRELIKDSDKIIHQSKGSEANKLYKFNGMYYHFFSEVKLDGRAVMMERSKNIYGPYTEIKQLSHAQAEVNEPNQGGIVETEKGGWYFLTHHGTGDWSGRIMSLLPVTWIDGWPIIGKVGKDTIGTMVWQGKMPVEGIKIVFPETSDDFNTNILGQQWEWNYQPRNGKWSLTERKGWLRLHAFRPLQKNNLLKAGNTLTQRSFRTFVNEVIIKLDVRGMTDGQKAGLSHFSAPAYSSIGVACKGKIKRLELDDKGTVTPGIVLKGNDVWLKTVWSLDGISEYSYSPDGKNFTSFGGKFPLHWGSYRGDRIAVYTYNNKADNGYVDIDFLHYNFK